MDVRRTPPPFDTPVPVNAAGVANGEPASPGDSHDGQLRR
jgi:hypothetical protein